MNTDRKEYPYSELTHRIIGIVYDVYNNLGYGFQERYYQRAIEEEFKKRGMGFEKERSMPIAYDGKIIGRYFIDFLINNSVVLEVKVAAGFYETHVNQTLAYMKHGNYKIGLLVLIAKDGVKVKRLII